MRLAKLREKAGLTQEELGRLTAPPNSKARIHQTRISSYELGTKQMPLDCAQRIIKVLNLTFKKQGMRTRAKLEHLLPARAA